MAASFEAFERAPRDVQNQYLSRLTAEERADFARGYDEYRIKQGAEAAKQVNGQPSTSTVASNVAQAAGTNVLANSISGGSSASAAAPVTGWDALGSSMPGATEAGALPAAQSSLGGALPIAGLAGMTYAVGDNFLQDGGKEVLQGKGNTQSNTDAVLNSNPITGWMNPLSKALGGDTIGGMFGGKSTKDYQAERRANVVNAGNKGWADTYERQAKGGENAAPEGITRGENGEWLKEDGSWDAREYAGVQGNADTFGDKWFQLRDDTRDKLVTQFKDEGLYHDDKGDKLISDDNQARARELFDTALAEQANNPLPSETVGQQTTGESAEGTGPVQRAPQQGRPGKPMPIDKPVLNEIPPVAPPPQPPIRTPQEYAEAYNNVYLANSVGSKPAGNIYLRRY